MTIVTLPQMNGSRLSNSGNSWLQSSVQDFFSTINWEGHPPEVLSSIPTPTNPQAEPVSLEMSVSRFFAAINWDGNAIAAPSIPIEQPKSKPQNEFTLDEFSDLF